MISKAEHDAITTWLELDDVAMSSVVYCGQHNLPIMAILERWQVDPLVRREFECIRAPGHGPCRARSGK